MRVQFRAALVACAAAAVLWAAPAARAAVTTQDLKYTVGGQEYVGFLAYDDATPGKRPGVLVAPEWAGVNDYARGRARQLAGMGYVAFVFDPYGGGRNAADPKQSAEWSGALKADRPELRRRVTAAFDTLKKQPQADPAKTAAIGYCFGGTAVLELARSGADVLGVVSLHGGLSTTMPAKAGEVRAKVLVCHGADDPFVPPAEVAGFEREMREAKADWQLVSYGNAVHTFTNPAAKGQIPGAVYEERADRRSWAAMKAFFAELFGDPAGRAPRADADGPLIGVFGTPGGGNGRRASASPAFGNDGDARKVVYVCDATGTMINKLGTLKHELTKAIQGLGPDQSYNVVFYTDGGRFHIADKHKLIPATPENKRDTYTFFDDITPTGPTDPVPALEAAFRQRPDVVYFLTDGEFGALRSYKELSEAVGRFNTGKAAKVNTILFETFEKEAEEALKRIAADHGGSYRYVREADLQ